MSTSRKWLILSHAFNMDGRAASLTVTDKLPYLRQQGIEPIVLSSVTGTRETSFRHEQILPWGPSALRFDMRHVLARQWGKGWQYRVLVLGLSLLLAPWILLERLFTGLKNNWSWSWPAYFRAVALLRQQPVELVYSSGGAYCVHMAAARLKRKTGCRWIAEIHDPMVMPGRVPRTRDEKFQSRLEKLICEQADAVWWLTQGALDAARSRHPCLGTRGFAVLPGANPPQVQATYRRGPRCVLGHFGSLSDTRSLAPVLRALKRLLMQFPEWRGLVRLDVYGAALDVPAAAELADGRLDGVVYPMGRLEHDPVTGLSGRQRVSVHMQQVDVLVLVHGVIPECSEYIPSKIYDYLWAGRPLMALTWKNPQLNALVLGHGGWVVDNSNDDQVLACLEDIVRRWMASALPVVTGGPITVEQAVHRILEHARHE
jgi:hypothetical protein